MGYYALAKQAFRLHVQSRIVKVVKLSYWALGLEALLVE